MARDGLDVTVLATLDELPSDEGGALVGLDATMASLGETAVIQARLLGAGDDVAGLQFDLTFPPALIVQAKPNGRPDCDVNPDIDKAATSFGFTPTTCRPGVDCSTVRAIVYSIHNTDPIPADSLLFGCRVRVAADAAPSVYPVECSNPAGSDPVGNAISDVSCVGANVEVRARTCTGDCNGNGDVGIDEILRAVNIALEATAVATCRASDADGDGRVTVNEILAALNRALVGCSAP